MTSLVRDDAQHVVAVRRDGVGRREVLAEALISMSASNSSPSCALKVTVVSPSVLLGSLYGHLSSRNMMTFWFGPFGLYRTSAQVTGPRLDVVMPTAVPDAAQPRHSRSRRRRRSRASRRRRARSRWLRCSRCSRDTRPSRRAGGPPCSSRARGYSWPGSAPWSCGRTRVPRPARADRASRSPAQLRGGKRRSH